MQKTYKCKNGHKFKAEEAEKVLCPSCNEPAEQLKWKSVDEFSSNRSGMGFFEEISSVSKHIKGK